MTPDVEPPGAIELEELTIRYGDVAAVSNVTVRLPRGTVGLLGRNGAGKSSILRALLGLVRPCGGTMRVAGLPPNATAAARRARLGYMPERDCHVPGLNGYETVKLAGELTGLPGRDAARRAHEVLYLVGLDEQRYRPVAGYSTGMRQKVKLAVALVHDPEILLLDEPTNGLDPRGRRRMLDLIRGLAADADKTVVLSSHILLDVETVCEHVVLLERGRVVAQGAVSELTRHAVRVLDLECDAPADGVREALLGAGAVEVEELGEGRFGVTVPESLPAREIFAAVLALGGRVTRLEERRRTLEEVFLGAVRDGARRVG